MVTIVGAERTLISELVWAALRTNAILEVLPFQAIGLVVVSFPRESVVVDAGKVIPYSSPGVAFQLVLEPSRSKSKNPGPEIENPKLSIPRVSFSLRRTSVMTTSIRTCASRVSIWLISCSR